MGKIRINELARELEVKSNVILEYLVEIGTQEKKSHSSALEDDLADKIRAHFHAEGEPTEKASEVPAAPEPPTPAAEAPHAPPVLDLKKLHELKPELHPLTRSIAEIKAAARKAVVAPPPPRPAAGPPSATGPVTAPVATKPVPGLERPAERPMPAAAVLASGAAGAPLAGGGRPATGRAVPGRIVGERRRRSSRCPCRARWCGNGNICSG